MIATPRSTYTRMPSSPRAVNTYEPAEKANCPVQRTEKLSGSVWAMAGAGGSPIVGDRGLATLEYRRPAEADVVEVLRSVLADRAGSAARGCVERGGDRWVHIASERTRPRARTPSAIPSIETRPEACRGCERHDGAARKPSGAVAPAVDAEGRAHDSTATGSRLGYREVERALGRGLAPLVGVAGGALRVERTHAVAMCRGTSARLESV